MFVSKIFVSVNSLVFYKIFVYSFKVQILIYMRISWSLLGKFSINRSEFRFLNDIKIKKTPKKMTDNTSNTTTSNLSNKTPQIQTKELNKSKNK